jgi:hypothetical protein
MRPEGASGHVTIRIEATETLSVRFDAERQALTLRCFQAGHARRTIFARGGDPTGKLTLAVLNYVFDHAPACSFDLPQHD